MKFKFSIILLSLFLFNACADDFLEVVPDNASSIEESLATPADAREFLNAAYDELSSGNAQGGLQALISELMTDGVDGTDINGDWFAHYTRSTDIFLGTTRSMMDNSFKAVGRANNVLDHLNIIEGLSDSEAKSMEGEVRFIRALVHFDIVRFFGQAYGATSDNSQLGIAIRTSQNTEAVNRSSVQDVYNQVIFDLEEAIKLLPATNDIYANSWSAKALLAKVYFQMNDFENSFDYANDVIENGPFTFDTDFSARYGYGVSTEIIFGLISTQIDSDNANGGYRSYFRPDPSNLGEAAIYPSGDIVDAFQVEPDSRFAAWFVVGTNGKTFCNKYAFDEVYPNPVLHLTEIKLIRAESAIENGNNDIGVGDLNDIRFRAGLTDISPSSATQALIQRCRSERKKALYFENNNMHELKRQAVRDTPNMLIRNAPWDCNGLVCQLPDNELKGNPEMEPNPQGGCN